jgi:hypothetical protein|tara:strand:+ start:147 stop:365 length:219 start_codon:yes stop_codon:yes gene_type:complete
MQKINQYFNNIEGDDMSISRDQINEAMSRFMGCGGSIRRFEKIVGEPILGSDIWLTEDTLEMIETNDFDLLG